MATGYAPYLVSTNAATNDDYSNQYQVGSLGGDLGWADKDWSTGHGYQMDNSGYNLATAGTGTGIGADSNLNAAGGILSSLVSGGSPWGTVGAGVGGLIGSYNNATTDTGSSVLGGAASGAASGAAIGSVVPGIGTAVGAVVGGILGGLGGLFGSSSKKKAAQKAYQQQLEASIAPYKQQQANYLQNQGLLQKAISNYGSAYKAGGQSFTNPMLKNKAGAPFTYGQPTGTPSLPDFGQGPSDVATGKMADPTKGINPLWQGQSQGNLLQGQKQPDTPNYSFTPPAAVAQPNAPGWSGNQGTDQSNLNAYQQAYIAYLNSQNQQRAASAVGNYSQFFGG